MSVPIEAPPTSPALPWSGGGAGTEGGAGGEGTAPIVEVPPGSLGLPCGAAGAATAQRRKRAVAARNTLVPIVEVGLVR